MNLALAAIAAIAVGAGVLAVSSRDVRATILGLLVVLLVAPLIASPGPGPLAVLVRIAAALLAVRLLLIGLRGEATTSGTRIGWPAEALLAGAGAVIGFGSHGLGSVGLGPAEAQAAGFGLVAIAVAPLATGRDVLRLGVAAVLVLAGASLIRAGLDAAPSDGEQLVGALLTIGLGGAIAVIVGATRTGGGLASFDSRLSLRGVRLPDAHRSTEPDVRPSGQGTARRGRRPDDRRLDDRHGLTDEPGSDERA